ncbi:MULTISPECIES: protein kinase domain-containing protein [Nocardiopsis]|uniref:non-specific serine/threonine protein kinase n=1 Tax=Nocardiopsis changdeensis TaxID=2831969 RepID=A0ABX8BFJ5_9ACTN|nr:MULTISPECIES: protein kinase [Nocardiopsis]QUX21017.1 protein kinase [Nocardiopsis changdeensis]QYX36947.1 protein kinase [Nocardiopsis sp. MT53]
MSLSLYVGPDSHPDKYRLVRSVGRGGEATLYLAEVTLAGQTEPVVVKALNADITADSAEFAELSARWAEQAELLRFINRLGVVGVREHFEGAPEHPAGGTGEQADRCLYLVMNHIDGLDLRDWRAEHAQEGVRGQREVLRYLEQVAQVLDMLHAGRATPSRRPVVHGDLSPGNIMIDTDGQATLVDFGLSRIAARHMTARPWFTPGYAAPEIFSGEYSPATDRYAFGAVAFYALTGEDPPTAPEQLRERFAALPLLADAEEPTRALVASMFSAEPADRPEASAWVGALRTLATSVPWTGPGSDPAGDPGTSAVFAASLFSAAAEDTDSTARLDPSVLPQAPAAPAEEERGTDETVVLPPPSGVPQAPVDPSGPSAPPVPGGSAGVPASFASGAPQGSAASGGAQGPGASSAPGASVSGAPQAPADHGAPPVPGGAPASGGAQGSGAPQAPSAPPAPGGTSAPGAAQASGVPQVPGGSADASPRSASGAAQAASASQGSTASGGSQGHRASSAPGAQGSGAPQAPGAPAGAVSPSASSGASGPGAPQAPSAPPAPGGTSASGGAPGPGAPQGAGGAPGSGGRGADVTAVLSPTPAFGTPAVGAPTPVAGTPAASADTESTVVLPGTGPGVEDMPHRPVGGMRGRPVQQRPAAGPPQPSSPPTASAPAGPPPGRPGRPTPPGGTARPPMPPPGPGRVPSGPMPSGPAYGGPPPPHSQPSWGPPPPPAATGAFPAYGHRPAPEHPEPRKRSRKPALIGLAVFAVVCMIGGSAVTYVVMDRGLPFLADGSQQVAADAPSDPAAPSEPEEEAPPLAAQPTGAPKEDASPPGTGPTGDTTLLTQMEIVDQDGRWEPGSGRAEIDGQAYSRALVPGDRCSDYNPCTGWAEYNLGRGWTTFTARLGVTDTSSSSATTTFIVHVDGNPEVTETLRLGETLDIEVDVRDALRLRIEVESDAGGVYPVWADPALTA